MSDTAPEKPAKKRVGRPATGREKVAVSVCISHKTKERLQSLADLRGVSMSRLVEEALVRFLDEMSR